MVKHLWIKFLLAATIWICLMVLAYVVGLL
jgi:hypothetical protein